MRPMARCRSLTRRKPAPHAGYDATTTSGRTPSGKPPRSETIDIKGAPSVNLVLRRSAHGPIITDAYPDNYGKTPVTLWWTFLETENPRPRTQAYVAGAYYRQWLAEDDVAAHTRDTLTLTPQGAGAKR
jgi:hypothetical protein